MKITFERKKLEGEKNQGCIIKGLSLPSVRLKPRKKKSRQKKWFGSFFNKSISTLDKLASQYYLKNLSVINTKNYIRAYRILIFFRRRKHENTFLGFLIHL